MNIGKRVRKLKKLFRRKEKEHGVASEKLLSKKSSFFVKEAYKTLRTNLIFSLTEAGGKLIVVTSSDASEGKTTNCLNTAITFAELGAKVCVVDCDLRKPNVARMCQEKGTPGLSNVLVNLNELSEVIHHNRFPNLDVIYSGDIPPNPAELLVSEKMDEIMQVLGESYDYVFFDTPPVNVATDASLLAVKANGVLLIVRQGKTGKDELAEAIQQLQFVKARILGILFNDADLASGKKSKGFRRKYYGYYGYYGHRYSKLEEKLND